MADITEQIYLDRDNVIDLLLKADGEAQDLSAVTRMVLLEDGEEFTIDSDEAAGVFDWETGTTGKITLTLGAQDDIEEGTYKVWLIVYDPSNTNGIVWDSFFIRARIV